MLEKRFPRCAITVAWIMIPTLVWSLEPTLAAEQPYFNGTWRRSEGESDNPQEKLQAARSAMRGGSERGGRGGSGGRRGGGGGRRGGSGAERGGQKQLQGSLPNLKDFLQFSDQLETALQENEFHVIPIGTNEQPARIFYLDGEKHTSKVGDSEVEIQSERRGDEIIIVQKTEQGVTITETYAVGPDGKRMIVTVRLEGSMLEEPILIRTVYDAQTV